jgi:hypothetical protein
MSDKDMKKPKFSLHRMNILSFAANAGIGSSCLVAAYYNTKSIPYISGFLWALGGSGTKVVPSFIVLSAATGLTQIGATALLLYAARSFFMNTYDICYKAE